ncbi:hypothetical protein CC80DRAFT_463941 [Byssothecium circinans]|uniref:Insecticidal toxin complex protein n=1 Tax=Byssothecium circinans TaxID=147558 RepID=A0A6A5UB82_9PLEO|nr:hypothetical protein CC80DRAFT_463941 [Byssothecium circinans]
MPRSQFLNLFGDSLDVDDAIQIHDNAMKIALRNEQALTHMHQAVRGTGLAAIDGDEDLKDRMRTFEKVAKKYAVNINLEELFGSIDFCECDNCTSMTSPAAYYVDLLQYLRNNNLDPTIDSKTGKPKFPNTGKTGYAKTALEKLLRRRPDLQHIELTCENTNTLIPYVDLVNEVMESFIFHEESYSKNWSLEKQVEIDAFNVRDETSNELLAEAQHTNYSAYCVLRQAVYPLGSLPYHQPVDAVRIYLDFLKTSRFELMDTFRKPLSASKNLPQTAEMKELYEETLDRACKAEFLSVIQEEYIILTKESFWPKRYFEIMGNTKLSTEAYQQQIGVRHPREYWGYQNTTDMLSSDEDKAIGLRFVKKQFLKRSGMLYTELVDLVKTNYVNPWYPTGPALAMLQSICFSYRFLQLLIDHTADNAKDRYRVLEWDRLQRFIRLWRRLGWSIDETDKALWGLSSKPPPPPDNPKGDTSDIGVKKLDTLGLEVIKLLALWAPISTSGEKSLYSRLFLTHNLLGIDDVFKADDSGAYLVNSTKVVDHIPVILAAFRIKRDELITLLSETGLLAADLTLDTISVVYRHVLISKSLKIAVLLLFKAMKLFGSPFVNASTALAFLTAYNEMTENGFSIPNLWYATQGEDYQLKPLGPSQLDTLKTSKALFDGLNAIDVAHPDLKDSEIDSVTEEMVTAKTSILFDASVVSAVNDLLAAMIFSDQDDAMSMLLAGDTTTKGILEKLVRAAIIINGFALSIEDIKYLQTHPADFGGFDLNGIKIDAWKQVLRFTKFRSSLPARELSLLDFMRWIFTAPDTTPTADICNQLVKVTGWEAEKLASMLDSTGFALTGPATFRDVTVLTKLQRALTVASNVTIDLPLLFKAANPMAKFWPTHETAEEIRKSIRSRYSLDDWEQAIKPLHDRLRMHERDALVAYLVVQEELIKWGVVDADSLFEFFLLDVQMGACLKTSRIKQAISTVQLFVQRCILGLEEKYGVENDALDQTRWVALSKETVRTANVKVLLTPENFIVPSLRDDKSPLYENLEKDILQKDVNPTALKESLTTYLYGLDAIANLRVEGLFLDDGDDGMFYIVAKTRSIPYQFYYRTHSILSSVWTPWELVPVDIPTYQVETTTTSQAYDGCYVNPVVWQNRFFIFFAEMAKKTIPKALANSPLANATPDQVKPQETWEIKLGWSELRNGKWTQKKTTMDSVMENATASAAAVDKYRFVSRFMGTAPTTWISIDVYKDTAAVPIGRFEFQGSQAYAAPLETTPPKLEWTDSTSFHFTNRGSTTEPMTMYCFQRSAFELNVGGVNQAGRLPYALYPPGARSASSIRITGEPIPFYHTFSHELLSKINTAPTFAPVFDTYQAVKDDDQDLLTYAFGLSGQEPTADGNYAPTFNELYTPYALYNWEFGFHAPMQLADALLQNQQYEAALAMCHYVFDPYADGNSKARVWKWKPFSLVSSEGVLDALFNSLQPHMADKASGQIKQWRDNPFMPHVVARARPVAYMKWTTMKYLEILIAYGDYYFRQNSLETVPLAIQCYVVASHIYGPAGQKIPKRGKKKPQTYFSLLDKWDAISNAVVDLELSFPFSNQIPQPYQFRGREISLANVFGFATARYFCIPDNPQLRAIKNTIDDRLYKLRHCQDINGNAISLALWDPPLDPMMLVNMAAQGLSLANVLNDLNAPMPNYRFQYLLQKSLELCAELRSMGEKFVTLKEKKDSLSLELLKSTHEHNIQRLIMDVRKLQAEEANKSIDALRVSRNGPHYRYKLFSMLGGLDMPDLVETDSAYAPIPLSPPKPSTDGDMVITATEKNEMDESKAARDRNVEVGTIEIINAMMESLPSLNISVQPWGVGVSSGAGPQNVAAHLASHARYIRILSDEHTFNASNSSRKAGYIRNHQERIQQANTSALEVKSIDAQIATQKTRILTAAQEMTNQQQQIDNAAEVVDFLKNKYTNEELYSWLESSVRTLFYQTYTLAYNVAKQAEAAFIFDRGPQPSPFIKFGYWNSARDGLQSGEQLYLALKQMESAYQDKRGHDFEIVKSISLRQINPLALLELREKGSCQIDLPEILFDMDWPGHYFRRIKSVSMTIPCVVGPYTSLNATLRLLSHRYRFSPTVVDSKSYPEQTDAGLNERFKTGAIPIDSIAVSTGQNDNGVFELNFKDERYNPFEGAGAISSWQIELPPNFRQFDYSSITDVVLRVMYVSSNGGEKMKAAASAAVGDFLKATVEDGAGFAALFDLRSEFATEWARASRPAPTISPSTPPPPRAIAMTDLRSRLPFFTKTAKKVNIGSITLVTATDLPGAAFSIVTDPAAPEDAVNFGGGATSIGKVNMFTQAGLDRELGDWSLTIQVKDAKMVLERVFVILHYTLS